MHTKTKIYIIITLYTLNGESCDLFRGVRGHAPPKKIKKLCNLVHFQIVLLVKCLGKNSLKISIFIQLTKKVVCLLGWESWAVQGHAPLEKNGAIFYAF